MSTVTTKNALANATKRGESEIVIEGDLANQVYRIKLVGPIAWGVAIFSIGGAVYLYLATPAATVVSAPVGGAGGTLSFGAGSAIAVAAASTIGINATIAAIGIAVAAGGIGVLTKLREQYKIVDKSQNRLVLKKKT